ncbi:polysaccharide lyase family 8 super-sandwich domain-containing protein [Propionibacteriaceae bacterium Y1923]
MRRRTFMAATAGGAASAGLLGHRSTALADTPTDHDRLIRNFVEIQAGTAASNAHPSARAKVNALVNTARSRIADLDPAAANGVFRALPLGTSDPNITATFLRLSEIALATVLPGAPADLFGNTELQERVIAAVATVQQRWLANQSAGYCGNWFNWEIGYPTHLAKILAYLAPLFRTQHRDLLLGLVATMDEYLRAGRDGDVDLESRFHTGANLADITGNRIIQGAVLGDTARIEKAVSDGATVYATVDPYHLVHGVTDGHYADGSFIQHASVAYTGSYGKILLQRSVQTIKVLQGTAWDATATLVPIVNRWVAEGFAPVIYEGWMMESVKGRGVSRTTSGYTDVVGVIESAADLAYYLPGSDGEAMKAWVKYLAAVTRVTVNTAGFVSPLSILRYLDILADQSVVAKNLVAEVSTHAFNAMERNVHLRPGYGFSLSRSSERISKYEYMSGENLRPWFSGDGAHQLYLSGQNQSQAFGVDEQVVVSPYGRPGTSAPVEERGTIPELYGVLWYDNPEQGFTSSSVSQNEYVYFPLGTNQHSGGAALGNYATASLVLSDDAARLAAQRGQLPPDFVSYANAQGSRSWFMFDDEIVVLSAGIGDRTRAVTSTVDARIAATGDRVSVQGGARGGAVGVGAHQGLDWAHWHNATTGAQVGYRYLSPTDAEVSLATRSGTHRDVRTGSAATAVTKQVFSLGSVTPAGRFASYAWMLLPGASAAQTAAARPIEVVTNSTVAQAVRHTGLGLTMINTYDGRSHQVAGLRVKGAASVVVHDQGSSVQVAVSDPVFNQRSITVEIDGRFAAAGSDDTVSIDAKPNKTRLEVNTFRSHGASHVATLQKR